MFKPKSKPRAAGNASTWAELQHDLDRLHTAARSVSFHDVVRKGDRYDFTYRVLSQKELDAIDESSMRLTRKRGQPDIKMDATGAKLRALLKGIVSGPPGWVTNEENIGRLPAFLRDDLVILVRGGSPEGAGDDEEADVEAETEATFESFREGPEGNS